MNRFYVDRDRIQGDWVRIDGEDVKHITKVLRLRSGDGVVVCDGQNTDYNGVIDNIGKDQVRVRLDKAVPTGTEANIKITLYQAVAKGTKMDLVIQKGTELGVVRFVPVITSRTVVKLQNKRDASKKVDRWQRIAMEAAKQSHRGRIPLVETAMEYTAAVQDMQNKDLALLPHTGENSRDIRSIPGQRGDYDSIAVMIGPEGGFENSEIQRAQDMGVTTVKMGPRIMRTETAGIAVTAVLMYRFGDLGGF